MGQWIRLEVPESLLRPVVERVAPFFGRAMPELQLISDIWVLGPILAGYHFRRPVFQLAGDGRVFHLDATVPGLRRQGGLILVPAPSASVVFPEWSGGMAFFHHILLLLPPDHVPEEPQPADPVAVEMSGRIVCAVRCQGPARIVARDHEDLVLPEGEWVAVHPFPVSGAD
ncbi:MAG: hypothetical protein ACP5OO_11205 [Chloroflexia bacterium]